MSQLSVGAQYCATALPRSTRVGPCAGGQVVAMSASARLAVAPNLITAVAIGSASTVGGGQPASCRPPAPFPFPFAPGGGKRGGLGRASSVALAAVIAAQLQPHVRIRILANDLAAHDDLGLVGEGWTRDDRGGDERRQCKCGDEGLHGFLHPFVNVKIGRAHV